MASSTGRHAEGRRAIFSASTAGPAAAPARGEGRRALFSVPEPEERRDPTAVECSACGARTPMTPVGLGRQLVPSWWLPLRRFPLLMRCPACRRPTWCRILPARTTTAVPS